MFKLRSIALLSWSEISVHTQVNLFHMSLLLFSLSSNQPLAKRQCGEKRKANPVYTWKRESKQKVARQLKWAASVEERLWLTNDEAKSGIGEHRTSLDAQPSSRRELRTKKGPLRMNTALRLRRQRRSQAKMMEPNLRSRLLCYEGKAVLGLSISLFVCLFVVVVLSFLFFCLFVVVFVCFVVVVFLGGGIWNQFIASDCVFIYSFNFPLMEKNLKLSWLPAFW